MDECEFGSLEFRAFELRVEGVGLVEWLVRAAELEDVEGVLRVEWGAATAPHWRAGEYERMVRGDGAVKRCLLVADAGGVVGFAVGMVAGEMGALESVAVEASWQRRGVGEALCREVLGWCRRQGARDVELEVRAGSLGAQRVYRRLGFAAVGQRRGYYENPSEDAVLMRVRFEAIGVSRDPERDGVSSTRRIIEPSW